MKEKRSLPKPITILVLTLLTAVIWVGLNIYRTFTIKPSSSVPEKITASLNPTLNTEAIKKIESSIYIPDSAIPQISQVTAAPVQPTPIPTPSVAEPLVATPSSEATVSASTETQI